ELGIESVLLHSEPDLNSRAYRMATKTICIGPAAVSESYLNITANIQAALSMQADAVHPGFGFLSENPDFAEAVQAAGMIFVGPSPDAIRKLGDKVHFKNLARKSGLPLIPGYDGEDQTLETLLKECDKIGYPVIVKAAAGGGGRGMKVIIAKDQAANQISSAQREAKVAFGSEKVFLEKYLDQAKHIEFQIFGDSTGKIEHLFERECSVQRRHQKIIEEALASQLSDETRKKMAECAQMIAQAGGYKSAGTVEFLLQDNKFYLLELNTRLQVEHPVTEEVMGLDLVKMQILTAQDEFVFDARKIKVPHGHAIECRLYAEDSYAGGLPSVGKLGIVHFPEGPRRRFEYGFEEGDEITTFYDPMIAKVIVWDESRPRAIQKMVEVLKTTVIFGVKTNIPFLLEILQHREFIMGTMNTNFIQKYFPQGLTQQKTTPDQEVLFDWARQSLGGTVLSKNSNGGSNQIYSPWSHPWGKQQ
ncbi:MAG: acetyl/propionyl/methylcrotonyl-CoA carboxylase subunit alpha, partial [Pseudobdellovibrionaceae bacterium]